MIKTDDIPQDVQWVWAMQWIKHPVGLDTLSKMHAIISAHPIYFPWETKYDSIPKEVHDAYYKEKNEDWNRQFQEKRDGGYKGLIPTLVEMSEVSPESTSIPQKSLSEMIADLFKQQEEERKAQDEKNEKDKALWDKYYKPYGLEYRK